MSAESVDLTVQFVDSDETTSATKTYSDDGMVRMTKEVPTATTDGEYLVSIDVSQIVAIMIVSNQNVTFETNNGTTPDDTLSLVANVPYVWTSDSYFANLLTTDITKVYITNSSGATATVKIRCLYDITA